MKIFLPFKRNWNHYLDEIEKFSVHTFIYDSYKNFSTDYQIVNIHWPESIFDWLEPTDDQLKSLKTEIIKWKKHSSLIYTKHDKERLKGATPNFTELFKLIEENTDVFIHLGEFSKGIYQKKYPQSRHEIVKHPLYEDSFKVYPKSIARERLNISQDTKVILAAGSIRTFEERKMVINAFKNLTADSKVLISNNMRSEIKYEFPGRVFFKRFFNIRNYVVNRFKKKYQPPQYLFSYGGVSEDELSLQVSASDVVMIPRINILNSGNLFLGLTFNKVVVGPSTGNITEVLRQLGLPIFDPNSLESVTKALEVGINMAESQYEIPFEVVTSLKPEKIARNMDLIFNSHMKP